MKYLSRKKVGFGGCSFVHHEEFSGNFGSDSFSLHITTSFFSLLLFESHHLLVLLSVIDHGEVEVHWDVGKSIEHCLKSVQYSSEKLENRYQTESDQEHKTDGIGSDNVQFWMDSDDNNQNQPDECAKE